MEVVESVWQKGCKSGQGGPGGGRASFACGLHVFSVANLPEVRTRRTCLAFTLEKINSAASLDGIARPQNRLPAISGLIFRRRMSSLQVFSGLSLDHEKFTDGGGQRA